MVRRNILPRRPSIDGQGHAANTWTCYTPAAEFGNLKAYRAPFLIRPLSTLLASARWWRRPPANRLYIQHVQLESRPDTPMPNSEKAALLNRISKRCGQLECLLASISRKALVTEFTVRLGDIRYQIHTLSMADLRKLDREVFGFTKRLEHTDDGEGGVVMNQERRTRFLVDPYCRKHRSTKSADGRVATEAARLKGNNLEKEEIEKRKEKMKKEVDTHRPSHGRS
jgi:hypothetical protein